MHDTNKIQFVLGGGTGGGGKTPAVTTAGAEGHRAQKLLRVNLFPTPATARPNRLGNFSERRCIEGLMWTITGPLCRS